MSIRKIYFAAVALLLLLSPCAAEVQMFRVSTENGKSGLLKVNNFGLIVETYKRLTNTRGKDTVGSTIREYRTKYHMVRVDRAPLQDGTVVGYEFKLPHIARGDKLIVHYTTKRPRRLPDGKVEYQDVDAPWTFDHGYSGSIRTLFTEFSSRQNPEFSGEWEIGLTVNGHQLISRKVTIFDPRSAQGR